MKALNFLLNLKQARDFDGNLESSLDEAIAELEALQQPKNNCDTCKWDDYCGTEENCISSKYIKDRYEPKLKEQ